MNTKIHILPLFLLVELCIQFSCHGHSSMGTSTELSYRKLAANPVCPMNFPKLDKLVKKGSRGLAFLAVPTECFLLLNGIRMVRSDYLQSTGLFTLPPNAVEPCWDTYEYYVNASLQAFNIRSSCGVQTGWISNSCLNISTRSDFESFVSQSDLQEIKGSCYNSLMDNSTCNSCLSSLSKIQATYFDDTSIGNVSDCQGYPFLYAGAFANQFGPSDLGTIKCFFSLDLTKGQGGRKSKKPKSVVLGIVLGSVSGFLIAVVAVWFVWKHKMKMFFLGRTIISSASGLELMSESTTVVRFTIAELKAATENFSRKNLIGKGGYGNVYRGVLPDGTEVALKRFKNCSVAGDENFTHEVEVIASVRHVNVVPLRGYCTETVPVEGHQRVIVCDLMGNGSLSDNLYGREANKLSWPIRRKIALGIAHGLAYLHNGVKPAIIHRDVKASNILLDEAFQPKLADFGLAKFTPEGTSHLSTKVAGTLGYVSPEYALYGKLSERSDVYSFGVVLLEILSGRKAYVPAEANQTLLLADWAWSLVREGRALDVIEENLTDIGPPEEMEKYVLVAVIAAHPLLYARPTMEQIVNILETNLPIVTSVPDHPLSIIAELGEIQRSTTETSSSSMFNSADRQQFVSLHSSLDLKKIEEMSPRHSV